jgi:Methyltransferase domain
MGRAPLHGVVWNLDWQLAWLQNICSLYYGEVAGLESYNQFTAGHFGPGFGTIESQVLHCFLRAMAPAHIVEIGGGVSTACMALAAEMNARDKHKKPTITCIEPFPTRALLGVNGINHINELCQFVPLSVFEQLEPGDLLSIDSSHAVKVGSEVLHIYLAIIPALKPGVFVHIHDIFLPYLYPRSVLAYPFASQETALVLALLTNNPHLQILASLSGLHYDRPVISAVQPVCNHRLFGKSPFGG